MRKCVYFLSLPALPSIFQILIVVTVVVELTQERELTECSNKQRTVTCFSKLRLP